MGEPAILRLAEALDSYIPEPQRAITACLNLVDIQLSSFDVKELFGRADGRLLVGCLEALRMSPAFKKTTHLPIPAGIGLENSQLTWVVGNRRNRLKNGQCAVP